MLYKPLAFAAAAAAFLVVPDVSDAAEDGAFWALPIESAVDNVPATAFTQSLSVPCPQCKGKDTHVQMDFAVEGGSRLLLNGFELYPNTDPWHGDLTASVVNADGHSKDRKLGYSLSVMTDGVDADQDLEAVSVELRIIEVGTRFMAVPPVSVKLIKTTSNDIMIANLAVLETTKGPEDECASVWCRFKHRLDSAMSKAKGCAKAKHGAHKGHHGGHHKGHNNDNKEHHAHEAGEQKTQSPAFSHSSVDNEGEGHRWGALWRNVAAYVFLPVLMGVTAGVGVAFLAMLLGSVIARVTYMITGKKTSEESDPSPKYSPRDVADASSEEKEGLAHYPEPPPRYEDARDTQQQ